MPTATLQATRRSAGPECCPTGLGSPIDRESAEELAVLLKAVADATRLQIIALLRASTDCAACVCDIAEHVGVSQPTVSHHLRILASAGIVDAEKRGYWTWYSLRRTRLAELSAVLT
jgi:ArsR family transcriptional regulator